jgi:hypothetical protein
MKAFWKRKLPQPVRQMSEAERMALKGMIDILKRKSIFSMPPAPSRWQRIKWALRLEKRPTDPPLFAGLEPGSVIKIRKPPRYVYKPVGPVDHNE